VQPSLSSHKSLANMQIKEVLRSNFPRLFGCLKYVFYFFRHRLESSPIGHHLNALIWRYKGFATTPNFSGFEVESAASPHRAVISRELQATPNIRSLLELGSGNGANLVRIKSDHPKIFVTGVEINPIMLATAKKTLSDQAGVRLLEHDIHKSLPFSDNQFDVTIADAVLMFITGKKIGQTLDEMVRVTAKKIIIHDLSAKHLNSSCIIGGRWHHDFAFYMEKQRGMTLCFSSKSIFPGSPWDKAGMILIYTKA